MDQKEERKLRLYNIQDDLVKSIETNTGNIPQDMAVEKCKNLVCTDRENRSVYRIRNTDMQIKKVIQSLGWIPLNLCCTYSGSLCVTMLSDEYGEQTRVERYFGSLEVQINQFDSKDHALYSSGYSTQ